MFNKDIVIPDETPFVNDVLSREAFADGLTKVLEFYNETTVLSIDSGWGTGKTTFLEMWRKKLQLNEKFEVVYFNAWINDDSEDPLIAMLIEFSNQLNLKEDEKTKFDKVVEKAKPIVKKGIPALLKILTHGVLDLNGVNLGEFNEEQLVELSGELGSIEFKV